MVARGGNGLRVMAAPFTVAAPAGARIRDRLRLSPADVTVVTAVGEHLGTLARADLAGRVRLGDVKGAGTGRARRKRTLTAGSSSRWAGAITRTSEDRYRLAVRALRADVAGLRAAIGKIRQRLAAPVAGWAGRVRGYPTQGERWQKQRRLQVLTARLAAAQGRLDTGRPAIVVGGRRLAKARHNLADAGITETEWASRWRAGWLFLTADGESGAPGGNYTIRVGPAEGTVTVVLPGPLRHLANAPAGRWRLGCTVTFHHRRGEWADRAAANQAVRYDICHDPDRDRWYLDASWATPKQELPTPGQLAAAGARLLGVDLNAGHLAACVVDVHGNPVGQPHTVAVVLAGDTARRDGLLRQAITDLIGLARRHGCAGIAIENLGFGDARAAGRETMGRGRRGRRFRRTVAGLPTARFRDRLAGMAHHAGLVVVAVDPAYTSRWGGQHWRTPLQQQTATSTVTGHHAAAVTIARRALGHRARRRPGVTGHHRSDGARRATGQSVPHPRPRGTTGPSRTSGTPPGGKTCPARHDQPAAPASNTVRDAPRQHRPGIRQFVHQ